jgi:hypothetical protein
MPKGGLNGTALASMAAGSILLYAGITGKSVLAGIQSIVSGKSPKSLPNANPVSGQDSSGTATLATGGPAPVVAGTYSHTQLEQLWISQGGNSAQANTAAAIAQAESGGQPNATNQNTDGSVDRGLWQINSVHGSQSTFDPAANARAAISISGNGSNWGPWVTFGSGAYRQFVGSS